jgi:hypothetical protein
MNERGTVLSFDNPYSQMHYSLWKDRKAVGVISSYGNGTEVPGLIQRRFVNNDDNDNNDDIDDGDDGDDDDDNVNLHGDPDHDDDLEDNEVDHRQVHSLASSICHLLWQEHMNGVDLADSHLGAYEIGSKHRRRGIYPRYMAWIISILLLNSFLAYRFMVFSVEKTEEHAKTTKRMCTYKAYLKLLVRYLVVHSPNYTEENVYFVPKHFLKIQGQQEYDKLFPNSQNPDSNAYGYAQRKLFRTYPLPEKCKKYLCCNLGMSCLLNNRDLKYKSRRTNVKCSSCDKFYCLKQTYMNEIKTNCFYKHIIDGHCKQKITT